MLELILPPRARLLMLICLIGGGRALLAQSATADTTLHLSPVEVTVPRLRSGATGAVRQHWDAQQIERLPVSNLGELLGSETGTFVKNYGLGSLSTSSVRGGNAGHTLVLWNGVPLQSPMLGLLDLALLPVRSFDGITFTRGGNAALWGSGAVGGVVELEQSADPQAGYSAGVFTELGSFGERRIGGDFGLGGEKFYGRTRLGTVVAENDFPYTPAPGLAGRRQSNAAVDQRWLTQDVYYHPGRDHRLAFHLWHQDSYRQIPPTNVQRRSEAEQDDRATRLLAEYRYRTDRVTYQFKAGAFFERLDYYDDQILLGSESHFSTQLAELTAEWTIDPRHQLLVGSTYFHTRANADGYRDTDPSEHKGAAFLSWRYRTKGYRTQVSLRQERVNGSWIPITASAGITSTPLAGWTLSGKVDRVYRLSTFNDRFWLPGGNPELLPEQGWSGESTVEKLWEGRDRTLRMSLTGFTRRIENWILWSIPDNASFWSANNITSVWSRGLESSVTGTWLVGGVKVVTTVAHDYVRSTNGVALENPRMAAGEQLIYTPEHRARLLLSAGRGAWHVGYRHQFTGGSRGISDRLAAYHVGNLRGQYTHTRKRWTATIFAEVRNAWNTDYLIVERRPMPGRHFRLGLTATLTNPQ